MIRSTSLSASCVVKVFFALILVFFYFWMGSVEKASAQELYLKPGRTITAAELEPISHFLQKPYQQPWDGLRESAVFQTSSGEWDCASVPNNGAWLADCSAYFDAIYKGQKIYTSYRIDYPGSKRLQYALEHGSNAYSADRGGGYWTCVAGIRCTLMILNIYDSNL